MESENKVQGPATGAQPGTTAAPDKAAKPKSKKKPAKAAQPEKPVDRRLPTKPAHEITLTPVPESRAYTATVHGKKVVVIFTERNRAKADARYNSVTVRTANIEDGKKAAKDLELPLYYGVQVRVAGKWDQGYLVTPELFKAQKQGEADFSLGIGAVHAYIDAKESPVAVRFSTARASRTQVSTKCHG